MLPSKQPRRRKSVAVPARSTAAALSNTGVAPHPFATDYQRGDNLCWAAVTVAIAVNYAHASLTQEQASMQMFQSDRIVDDSADIGEALRTLLGLDTDYVFGNFFADPDQAFRQIGDCVADGKPVPLVINWDDTYSYHSICAFDRGSGANNDRLYVFDPAKIYKEKNYILKVSVADFLRYAGGPDTRHATGHWYAAYFLKNGATASPRPRRSALSGDQ